MAQVSVLYLLDCTARYMQDATKMLEENRIDGAKLQAVKALALLETVSTIKISEEDTAVYEHAAHILNLLSKKIIAR